MLYISYCGSWGLCDWPRIVHSHKDAFKEAAFTLSHYVIMKTDECFSFPCCIRIGAKPLLLRFHSQDNLAQFSSAVLQLGDSLWRRHTSPKSQRPQAFLVKYTPHALHKLWNFKDTPNNHLMQETTIISVKRTQRVFVAMEMDFRRSQR